jgi:hypothetical protein
LVFPRVAARPVPAALHALRAPSAGIDLAELLKRIYDVDALACPCGGRLRFIAFILDEEPAREILDSLLNAASGDRLGATLFA